MTYTAWDYRKLAEYHEQLGNAIIAKHYLAFADTLEENARLRAAIEGRQAMSYTAEQLRAKARNLRELGRQLAADDCEAHADALEENARLRAELAKLRQHAEAMANAIQHGDEWDNAAFFAGLRDSAGAYRADFPEEK